jgi:hypothetical protein
MLNFAREQFKVDCKEQEAQLIANAAAAAAQEDGGAAAAEAAAQSAQAAAQAALDAATATAAAAAAAAAADEADEEDAARDELFGAVNGVLLTSAVHLGSMEHAGWSTAHCRHQQAAPPATHTFHLCWLHCQLATLPAGYITSVISGTDSGNVPTCC